jgi:hypothetical protein
VSRAESAVDAPAERAPWGGRVWLPLLIAAAATAAVLLLIVAASRSAWDILGVGRGVVPPEYYHVSGFVIVLATAFGQAVGWAGGSGILFHVMTRLGFGATWSTARIAMSIVYLGLGALPLSVYHALYGRWLLGLPRTGLPEWLAANHPDARWFVIGAHPVVDLSLIPLAVVFLGGLWGWGEQARRSLVAQTVLALALLGTSLAVALSLAIHSTLVHIRL